jgi:hypothetical protein
MGTKKLQFALFLVAQAIIAIGCVPSLRTNPSATALPTIMVSTLEPETEMPSPTPLVDGPSGQDVHIIMNRGAPANRRCVAMRPGSSPEAPPVYQAANPESPLVARLGNWADIQQLLPSWYSISIPAGGIGWVEAAEVELNMGCGTSGPIRLNRQVARS